MNRERLKKALARLSLVGLIASFGVIAGGCKKEAGASCGKGSCGAKQAEKAQSSCGKGSCGR